MEIFFIFVLWLVLFAVWRGGRDATDQLRNQLQGLEQEIAALRDRLAALQRSAAAPAASTRPAQTPLVKPPETAPPPVQRLEPAPPNAAQRSVPPPIAPFKPAAEIHVPAPVPVPPPPAPAPVQPPPMPVSIPVPPQPAARAPKRAVAEAQEAARASTFSLEERLGGNWLNKLGIAILVIGLAFFLAFKLQTWGPGGKVLCGYAVSFALLAGGVWLERKDTYRIFARGGIGGGWALAFFTTFAMYHLPAAQVLHSLATDLVLMLVVAAGMVVHSLRYRSQAVTGLAFLLGFATLLTSHLESGDGTVVFSLTASAVLALALVVVTTMRHWAWLELTGLVAVYLSHFVWLSRILPENHAAFTQFWPSTLLILFYWLIFRMAYVQRTPLDRKEESISSLSAVLNSTGVLGLLKLQSVHPEWAFWTLMALGAMEMGLAFRVRARRRQAFVVLTTIATVLLVAAVPFKFQGVSWPVLWLVEAQVLAVCGLRLDEPVFRRLGLLAGVLTGGVLAFHAVLPLLLLRLGAPDPDRHISLTTGLALAAILYWIHAEVYPRRWPQIAADTREAFALRLTSWLGLAAAATALWVALPDLWLPVGWLALVLALGFAAHRFSAKQLSVEADLLTLGSAAVLVFHHFAPLLLFRLDNLDPSRHWEETTILALAAAAYWIRSEVYPRLLPSVDPDPSADTGFNIWQALALPAASWLGLAAAATALWVVLPDLWVPVGWLTLLLLLGFASYPLKTALLAVEADALILLSTAVLAFHHVAPLLFIRLDNADPSHHPAETAVLTLAAVAYWIRSEVCPRVFSKLDFGPTAEFDLNAWQTFALPAASWLGVAAAASALWVVLPAPWIAVGWLALVLLLGFAADGLRSEILAVQADLLAVAALPSLLIWDVWTQGWFDHKAPLIASVVLLYAGIRRKTVLAGSPNYVAPAYSWAATLLMAFVVFDLSTGFALAPVWTLLGLTLFEIGRVSRKGFLRWQGFLLVALAFVHFLFNVSVIVETVLRAPAVDPSFSIVHSLLLEVLLLAAIGYWLMERTRNRDRCTRREYAVGLAADALGTLCIALWFAYRFPSQWVPVQGGEAWVTAIWAGMALVLAALATLLRRRAFLVHALALVLAVAARGLFFDLAAVSPASFWRGPLFQLAVTSLLLLGALPFAFRLRGVGAFGEPTFSLPGDLALLLRNPHQWFFFAAFGLQVVALAVKLSSGHITIAWSLLGLGVFLFALAVGERSFRLAGLGLLLASVGKILVMDVWKLSPSDRYTTLIVLGLALLAVSFLYTRFGAVMRKFL